MDVEELQELGFTKAADEIKAGHELKRKMTIAYEHYRYVRPEKIDRFNEKLKARTLKETGRAGADLYHHYDQLVFIPISAYGAVPPQAVLTKIKEAKERKCFDTFEVCKIEGVKEYKDPIIFGRIEGCPHRFFVAQFDNDIRIEDILEEGEG